MSVTRRRAPAPRVLFDVAVAGMVTMLAVIDVASVSDQRLPGERPADAFAYTLVIAGSMSLVWRRRAPIVVLAVVSTTIAAVYLRGHGAFLPVLGLPALYAVAAHTARRAVAWWALGLASVGLMVAASVSLLDTDDGFEYLTALSMIASLVGAVVAGVVIRNRERIFVDSERRAAAAEADRLAEAERAVVRERSRIAREMHDVVAHGMSVIAVQAAAGREIVHANPDKAADVFASIEAVGRESLMELRRMLGVLRDSGDDGASRSPQPGISDIAVAVAQSSEAGVATDLIVEGWRRPLSAGIELAAFRIVQEALTNVRRHAGRSASATVHISYEADNLVVEVTDDGRGAVTSLAGAGTGTGHGLIGMRERVEIYGGELTSGPRLGGGFAVCAILPIVQTDIQTSAAIEGRP
jgi:signal transduction histidine kinase